MMQKGSKRWPRNRINADFLGAPKTCKKKKITVPKKSRKKASKGDQKPPKEPPEAELYGFLGGSRGPDGAQLAPWEAKDGRSEPEGLAAVQKCIKKITY